MIFKDKRLQQRRETIPVLYSLKNASGQRLELKPQEHVMVRSASNGWVIVTFQTRKSIIADFALGGGGGIPRTLQLIAYEKDKSPLCEASVVIED